MESEPLLEFPGASVIILVFVLNYSGHLQEPWGLILLASSPRLAFSPVPVLSFPTPSLQKCPDNHRHHP